MPVDFRMLRTKALYAAYALMLPAWVGMLLSLPAKASDDTVTPTQSPAQAYPYGLDAKKLRQISDTVGWRRLLLFSDHQKSADQSSLDNPRFFLAPTGHQDAHAELIAMLEAMQAGDADALCRFVARVHYLQGELAKMGIDSGVSGDECADFQAFAKSLNAKHLSLVFAEEHPNKIASAFAHVLMRADDDQRQDTQAMAINYTVQSDSRDPIIRSTLKSLVGGYPGVMEIMPFSKKAEDYLVKDERDLWQFELDLTSEEVAQIIRHIWEVKDMERPYFFTHDNCATEIVRLIDVVRPQASLRAHVGKIVIPSRIASILADQGFVRSQKFIPSNATIRQAALNHGQAVDPDSILPSRNNPIHATPVHRIGLGAGMDDRHDDRAVYGVQINAAYQDLLDNPNGVRPLLDVRVLSLDVIKDAEKAKINELTIFATRSLNPANTAKNNATDPTGIGKATGMRLGFIQSFDASSTANEDHLVMDLGIQKGKSWALGQARAGSGEIADTVCYVLADGGAQVGRINQGYRLGLGAVAGCVHYATPRLRAMAEVSLPYYYHPDRADGVRSGYLQPSVRVGMQADIDRVHALRLTAKHEKLYDSDNTQAMLSLQRYF